MKVLLVLFLKFFKFLKFGKIFSTGGTMLLSIVLYSFQYGWRYAVGFVGLIFVHEMGHYLAARQKGLDVGAPIFIPFLGAAIALKEQPRSAETEAYVAMAGPFIGTIGALVCYFLGRELDSQLLLALSYSGFFINLFNLIPVPPLDGGRITGVLSPRLWLLGVPILIVMILYRPSPILFMLVLLAAPRVWRVLRGGSDQENPDYYVASAETRLTYALLYIGLIIFLALMAQGVYEMLGNSHHKSSW